jgi:hypothetical protein
LRTETKSARLECPTGRRELIDPLIRLVHSDLFDRQYAIKQAVETGMLYCGIEHDRRSVRQDRCFNAGRLQSAENVGHLGERLESQVKLRQFIA